MSQLVPLDAVASQTLSINLGGQACLISVYTLGVDPDAHLYMDLNVNGAPIVQGRVCRNENRVLVSKDYLGFLGDFMFVDIAGDTDPAYAGLGIRYQLLYLLESEIPS